ncbi:MAG: VWA domain-containing protein, partial [Comamonadaceae bacterium CG_4_10_14_3_um_filter_60_42]
MEELVGRWWHQALTRATRLDHPGAAVQLQDMQKCIGIFFRTAGGPAALRFTPASMQVVGGQRHWLQKLAGSGQRADTAQLEPDVLALPATLAVFDDAQLNRDLYLWLAMLSARFVPSGHWIRDNLRATQAALAQFPGFAARYQALLQAHLAQRPSLQNSGGKTEQAESTVQAALREQVAGEVRYQAPDVAPVWLWLSASTTPVADRPASQKAAEASQQTAALKDKQRRRTQATSHEQSRNPMVLPFRAEAIMSWSEMVHVNRSTDDEEDGNALNAANDMDKLSVAPDGQTLASRVKFDLDLP